MRFEPFRYMEWAKLKAGDARHNLAASGVRDLEPRDLDLGPDDWRLEGAGSYGPPDLVERLAAFAGVAPDRVFLTAGCSMANWLILSTVLEPGDEAIVEKPAYECLFRIPEILGARVKRFERRAAEGYQPDPDRLHSMLTPRTRVVVLTDLHNPTGVRLERSRLDAIVGLAEARGFELVMDEVYLDMTFGCRPPTSARLSDRVTVTSSFTKAYGLGGIRVGWILARPDLVHRASRLHDYMAVNSPSPSLRVAARALVRIERLRERTLAIATTGYAAVRTFLDGRRDLEVVAPAGSLVIFPRLSDGTSADSLAERLRHPPYSTVIVPGAFFEDPSAFRLGFGAEPEVLRAGLSELGQALDERRR